MKRATLGFCLRRPWAVMLQMFLAVALLSATASAQKDVPERGGVRYTPAVGPFEVAAVKEVSLVDKQRKKVLTLKIRYPHTNQAVPVILFSHGYTYDNNAFGPLSEFWARHGYVVIHPTHADARVLTKQTGKPVRMSDPATWSNRAADLSFVIDSLEEIQDRLKGFQGKLDVKRLGVGGHSFGAYTSMLIGGATVLVPGREKPVGFADNRVRAILPIAGQGRGQQGLHDHSWDKVTLPMMMITGSRDRGLNKEEPRWRAEGFKFSPAGEKYWAFVTDASHFSYDGRTGKATQNRISTVVKTASLAFWDAYLQKSDAAKEYLISGQLQADYPEAVEFFTK